MTALLFHGKVFFGKEIKCKNDREIHTRHVGKQTFACADIPPKKNNVTATPAGTLHACVCGHLRVSAATELSRETAWMRTTRTLVAR